MATSLPPNPWMPFLRQMRKAESSLRLFCFSYAGGSASVFRRWQMDFPSAIEVCPIQLPGRENRIKERPFSSLPELIQELAGVLPPFLDKKFAFFGHSMGSLISFELACYLRKKYHLSPSHLFLSGCSAPQQLDAEAEIYLLPDAELIHQIHHRYNGIPVEVLENKEFLELILPVLRADFTLVGNYIYHADEPLACPITAFGGLEDKSTTRDKISGWANYTQNKFSLHMFPGDHFFLRSTQPQIIQVITQELI